MAIPLLAPFGPLVPVLKIVALGSVKFIALGVGASVLPVQTANFLVGMSSSTPLKHAEFRFKKGYIDATQIEEIRVVFKTVNASITDPEQFLSRVESREFLLSVMTETWIGMKQSVLGLPARLAAALGSVSSWLRQIFGRSSNQDPKS